MKCLLKNVFIDKLLFGLVDKYNNTYRSTIKMKPIDIKQIYIFALIKRLSTKILNLKLNILLEYQNVKPFPKKITLQSG